MPKEIIVVVGGRWDRKLIVKKERIVVGGRSARKLVPKEKKLS
jgi:hypothetical protein